MHRRKDGTGGMRGTEKGEMKRKRTEEERVKGK